MYDYYNQYPFGVFIQAVLSYFNIQIYKSSKGCRIGGELKLKEPHRL